MSGPAPASKLAASRDEIAAAKHLHAGGFFRQAVSRSYYGAFAAAESALEELGETRSKHSAVLAAFNRLVVHEGGADPDAARLLRHLFDRRNTADYARLEVAGDEAQADIDRAERVISAVGDWFADRQA